MKLFGRACIITSLALLPFACSSDENNGSGGTQDAGPTCGDGVAEGSEDCDGDDLGGANCGSATMNSKPEGTLGCMADCSYDVSDCSAATSTGGMTNSTGGTTSAGGTMGVGGTMGGGSGGGDTDGGDTGGSTSGGSGGDSGGATSDGG